MQLRPLDLPQEKSRQGRLLFPRAHRILKCQQSHREFLNEGNLFQSQATVHWFCKELPIRNREHPFCAAAQLCLRKTGSHHPEWEEKQVWAFFPFPWPPQGSFQACLHYWKPRSLRNTKSPGLTCSSAQGV